VPLCSQRSSTDRTLTVPRTHNRFGDRSFAVAEPRLWNSLPISLQQISSYRQLGDIWEIIYLGFEKSQRSVTHDSLRYINRLTYLLTYLKWGTPRAVNWWWKNSHYTLTTAYKIRPLLHYCYYYCCKERIKSFHLLDAGDSVSVVLRQKSTDYL